MNEKDCKLHMRVAMVSQDFPCLKGKVVAEPTKHPTHGSTAIVEWDSGVIQRVTLRSLLTEQEGLAQDKRLEEKASKRDAMLEDVFSQVQEKMRIAANAVNEAHELARSVGKMLPNMHNDDYDNACDDLFHAMENAGWSMSSLNC